MMESPKALFSNPGYCACCRAQTLFTAYGEWLRDFYLCGHCGSVPRQRHLHAVLDENFAAWHSLTIHESSPSNDGISRWCSDYSSSQFFPDVPRGSTRDGVRSEDIENLTFADESIDLFITQDVLEHVFHPDRAIREIHRVLRPGGAHVFTAPKHRGLGKTRQRARLREDGALEHLLPAEYHGNPIGDNKALVTFDYGDDFEELLSQWSGGSVMTLHRVDRARGLDAAFNEVFVIRKPGTLRYPVAPAPEPEPRLREFLRERLRGWASGKRCAGRRRMLDWLTQAAVLRRILRHLHLPELPPPLAPARGAPQQALWD